MQVNENLNVLKAATEGIETSVSTLLTSPAAAYVARAALSPETLEGSGSTTWTNPAGKRIWANFDFQLKAPGSFGCIVKVKVGGVSVAEFYLEENGKEVRMGDSFLVSSGEAVVFELSGGGTARLSGMHVSYRAF